MMDQVSLLFLSIWEIFGLVLVCSACVFGFYATCKWEGDHYFDDLDEETQKNFPKPKKEDRMIFWFVRYYLAPIVGPFYSKPIYRCPACMGSLHSILPTILFFSYLNFPWQEIILVWPFIAFATCGINWLITTTWEKIDRNAN